MSGTVFRHVNIVARDWKRLAAFYTDVFGCEPVPPERDLSGPALEAATGVPGAHIRGTHLRLPGSGVNGPTLEVFQYEEEPPRGPSDVNAPGLAHIAFEVDDVGAVSEDVVRRGGSAVGEVVELEVPGRGVITFVYMRDPEGNIIELQSWCD